MDITQIKHIAKLSYLEFSEEEMARFTEELSAIVDYVSELEKAPTEGVPVSASPHTSLSNVFRSDGEFLKENLDEVAALLESAPEREDGYVKVKAVL